MKVTEHFYTAGDNARWNEAPPAVRDELRRLAELLEKARAAGGGVPVLVTSGYRPGDSKQHGKGQAADLAPLGLDGVMWARRIIAAHRAGQFPDFGQLIVYPHTTRHVHLSTDTIGGGRKNEVRIETGEGVYPLWDGAAVLPWGTPAGAGAGAGVPNNEGASSPIWLALIALAFFLFAWGFL
jgi:hypothetical protein